MALPYTKGDLAQDVADIEDPKTSAFGDIIERPDYDLMPDDEKIDIILGYLPESMSDDEKAEIIEEVLTDVDNHIAFERETNPGNPDVVAKDMADQDNTDVSVTEVDSDDDGDTDTTIIEKTEPEDDTEEKDNSSESEDKPHDEESNSTNRFAKYLDSIGGPGR